MDIQRAKFVCKGKCIDYMSLKDINLISIKILVNDNRQTRLQ